MDIAPLDEPQGTADIYGGMAIFHTIIAMPHFIDPQKAGFPFQIGLASSRVWQHADGGAFN